MQQFMCVLGVGATENKLKVKIFLLFKRVSTEFEPTLSFLIFWHELVPVHIQMTPFIRVLCLRDIHFHGYRCFSLFGSLY